MPDPPKVHLAQSGSVADPALVHRIAECYARAVETLEVFKPNGVPCDDKNYIEEQFGELAEKRSHLKKALDSKDEAALADIFGNMFRSHMLDSFAHHEQYYAGNYGWYPGHTLVLVRDIMLSLGEALGVTPCPSFSQIKLYDYIDYVNSDLDTLYAHIEKALGFSLEMPMVGGPPTFIFNGVRTSGDMIRHAYPPYRMRQLGYGPTSRVAEMGAGFGSMAYLAVKAGVSNYTLFDVPIVNAVQMFFLGSALGADKVSGYGEEERDVKILPLQAMKDVADKGIDLMVNMDSLPEYEAFEGMRHLREIRRISKKFLSVNQECRASHPYYQAPQTVVCESTEKVGGFSRVYRTPYWILEGYVEELYDVT